MSSLSLETPAWFAIQFMGVPLPAVLGGLLIGLAAVVLYLSIGRIAGISGIFFGALNEGGTWRWLFLAGIIAGAGTGECRARDRGASNLRAPGDRRCCLV